MLPGTLDTPDNRAAMPDVDPAGWVATAALASDVVVVCVGEPSSLSGEAASRSDLRLPGRQADLIRAIAVMDSRGLITADREKLDAYKGALAWPAALAAAQTSVRIMSPYFLPDDAICQALDVAAMRGVEVDIVIPAKNNLAPVAWAMTAPGALPTRDRSSPTVALLSVNGRLSVKFW